MDTSSFCCSNSFILVDPRSIEQDIVEHRCSQQFGLLRHNRDSPIPVVCSDIHCRNTRCKMGSRRRFAKTQQDLSQSRLPAAGRTDDAQRLPRFECHVHMTQRMNFAAVGIRHIV